MKTIKSRVLGAIAALLAGGVVSVSAQSPLFTESFGSPVSSNLTIPQAVTAGQFDNSATLTFSSVSTNGQVVDIRNGSHTYNYTPNSGDAVLYLPHATSGGDQKSFTVAGIDTTGYVAGSFVLKFGAFRGSGSWTYLTVGYSTDGTNFTPISYAAPPAVNQQYHLVTVTGLSLPSTTNLRLRFTNTLATGSTQIYRIDDISLLGDEGSAGPLTFAVAEDAHVKQAAPGTNFGLDGVLQVSNKSSFAKAAYLKFDVSGVPAGATVTAAKLWLRPQSTVSDRPVTAKAVASNSWTETSVVWTGRPAMGVGLATVSNHSSTADSIWDVTPHITGNGTFSIGLESGFSDDTNFISGEGADVPVLVVEYAGGGSGGDPEEQQLPLSSFTIYRGLLHGHTNYTSSHGDQVAWNDPTANGRPSEHYALAKSKGWDFYHTADHSQEVDLQPVSAANPAWLDTLASAEAATDSSFVALVGVEHSENSGDVDPQPGGGHFCPINNATYLNAATSGVDVPTFYNWLKTVQPAGDEGYVSCSFNHPATSDFNSFGYRDAEITDIITTLAVFNRYNNTYYNGFVAALNKGWKVGPVHHMDNHGFWHINNLPAPTTVLAASRTKSSITWALKQRRTFASMNYAVDVKYAVNGYVMGSTLPGLPTTFNFQIEVNDPDTGNANDRIGRIEIMRNTGTTGVEVAASQDFSSHSVTWSPTIQDSVSSYFFLRIYHINSLATASTYAAPVWTGR